MKCSPVHYKLLNGALNKCADFLTNSAEYSHTEPCPAPSRSQRVQRWCCWPRGRLSPVCALQLGTRCFGSAWECVYLRGPESLRSRARTREAPSICCPHIKESAPLSNCDVRVVDKHGTRPVHPERSHGEQRLVLFTLSAGVSPHMFVVHEGCTLKCLFETEWFKSPVGLHSFYLCSQILTKQSRHFNAYFL